MKKSKYAMVAIILCMSFFRVENALAKTVNSAQLIQDTITAASSCTHYKVIGACFWQKGIDHFSTTLKVDEYVPDVVVSVYDRYKDDPWWFANTIVDPTAHGIGEKETEILNGMPMTSSDENLNSNLDTEDHFKEVDVIGNPGLLIFSHLFLNITSNADSFKPYYSSMIDAHLWRSPENGALLHFPEDLLPTYRMMGTMLNNWGSIVPRTGFVDQPDDAKAAALIAQRSADIVTHEVTHVKEGDLSSTSCGKDCKTWQAKENDGHSIQWQMVYPKESNRCVVFASNDTPDGVEPWDQSQANKGNGDYAWIMWRHYKGCIKGKGHYIGSLNF